MTERAAQLSEEDLDVEEAYEHSEEERSGLEEEVAVEEVVDEIQSEPAAAADSTSSNLEEAPKKSYASIVSFGFCSGFYLSVLQIDELIVVIGRCS